LAAALATWSISIVGVERRKFMAMFGVIGAAAGISAGFGVLITGFVYVIEELTRTLSRRLAMILALAAAVAMIVRQSCDDLLHYWVHAEHHSLMPDVSTWDDLTDKDIRMCLLLSIPIGTLNGIAGWAFTQLTWKIMTLLKPALVGREPFRFQTVLLPQWSHLAIIGFISGCLGAVVYEVTGMNGVWGTTIDGVPYAVKKGISWEKALVLFLGKFFAFVLACAGGGPGGMLLPSLVCGGFMGIAVGRFFAGEGENADALVSATGVMGMGSLFASVMNMPLSGVIVVFELTRSGSLLVPVVFANFVATNVTCRLPGGEHHLVHRQLEADETWDKLNQKDFIETDEHEQSAEDILGLGRLRQMSIMKMIWMTDDEKKKRVLQAWAEMCRLGQLGEAIAEDETGTAVEVLEKIKKLWLAEGEQQLLQWAWNWWLTAFLRSIMSRNREERDGLRHTPLALWDKDRLRGTADCGSDERPTSSASALAAIKRSQINGEVRLPVGVPFTMSPRPSESIIPGSQRQTHSRRPSESIFGSQRPGTANSLEVVTTTEVVALPGFVYDTIPPP
jgi:H+/Cl- antiporter ClcA